MAHRQVGIALLLLCLPTVGEAVDNPYTKAKVGDYAVYSEIIGLARYERTITKTLVTKEENYLTFTVVTESKGKEVSFVPEFVDLNKPFPMLDGCEKVTEGTEQIRVAGKLFNSKWFAFKTGGKEEKPLVEFKLWYCLNLPLPLLKAEKTITLRGIGHSIRTEAVEFGHKAM